MRTSPTVILAEETSWMPSMLDTMSATVSSSDTDSLKVDCTQLAETKDGRPILARTATKPCECPLAAPGFSTNSTCSGSIQFPATTASALAIETLKLSNKLERFERESNSTWLTLISTITWQSCFRLRSASESLPLSLPPPPTSLLLLSPPVSWPLCSDPSLELDDLLANSDEMLDKFETNDMAEVFRELVAFVSPCALEEFRYVAAAGVVVAFIEPSLLETLDDELLAATEDEESVEEELVVVVLMVVPVVVEGNGVLVVVIFASAAMASSLAGIRVSVSCTGISSTADTRTLVTLIVPTAKFSIPWILAISHATVFPKAGDEIKR
mmetsp:Transcript_78440/g.197042  ORF Transcript_78440/g.197042 Transcript_78440/m.197042 type:complete len:327 (-) Transcript_78440:2137-3117(-)